GKRHPEFLQELVAFFIGLGSRDERNVHPADLIYFVNRDFRENDLFLHAQRVITTSVKPLGTHTTEVANARQRDVHQAIQEFIHPVTTQGYPNADRHVLSEFAI